VTGKERSLPHLQNEFILQLYVCTKWFHINCLAVADKKKFRGLTEKDKKDMAYKCLVCKKD
jgi:hypothetical protein